MANTISGRYGSVQRILPSSYTGDGKPVWSGQISPYEWAITAASDRWTKQARPTPDGLEGIGADYSNTVSAIQSWTLENTTQPQSYAASNTRGFQAKFAGIRSCTGNIKGVGGFPPLNPGNRFLFRGFVGPESGNLETDNGYLDVSGYVYQIAAVANQITINVDYGSYAPITWQVQWQSDFQSIGDEFLSFGVPTDDMVHDLGFYDLSPPPCDQVIPSTTCMLRIGDEMADARDNPLSVCLQSANLTFNTTTQQIANSCSAKAGGWQSMLIGTTDVTMAATIQGSNYAVLHPQSRVKSVENDLQTRSRLHLPGMDRYVRLYIGNNDDCVKNGAWEFYKMFVGSYGGLNVDLASGNILSFNSQFEFNAFPRDDDNKCYKGYIRYRLPDGNRVGKDDWPINPKTDWTKDEATVQDWVTFTDLRS
jgi:hypothetical protein